MDHEAAWESERTYYDFMLDRRKKISKTIARHRRIIRYLRKERERLDIELREQERNRGK